MNTIFTYISKYIKRILILLENQLRMKENIESAIKSEIPKGYRVYNLKGVNRTIVAKKGGPTKEQIQTKSTYQKLRNNQKEFAVASMMSKMLRNSLTGSMGEICETYVSGRLTAQFRNLAKLEEGITGTRPLFLSKHGHLLNGFEFNTTCPYDRIFGAQYYVKAGSREGQVILHFPAFIPDKTFKKPKDATNFKVNARLVAISDYEFDKTENTYLALNKDLNGRFGTYESPMLPLLKIPTEPITTQISIDHKNIGSNSAYFLIMAISFYNYSNGRFYHLAKDSGMTIKQVLH